MAASYIDSTFRTQFPEFSNVTQYPAAVLANFFAMAQIFISDAGSPCNTLSGNQLQLALNQLTAHLTALSGQAQIGVPGSQQGGFDVSASIGEINVSKLSPPAKDSWDFWLYQTMYGQMLLALLSALAVGGLAVGGIDERSSFRKAGGCFW